MKKLLLILLFICMIFSSCQISDEQIQDNENFESSESSSVSENISDESKPEIVINTLYDLSYDEYFSKEYRYEDTSGAILDENIGFGIGDAKNLYIRYYDDKNGFKRTVASNVDDYIVTYDELIYSVKGEALYSATLYGTYPKEIYTLPSDIDGKISSIFGTPELIWMKIGDSIYRLHRSSGILDKLYSNENIAWYKPISNYSIKCDIYTDKWLEYIESGGDPDEQVLFSMTKTYIYNSKTDEFYEAQYYDDDPYTVKYEIEEDNGEN